MNFEEALFFLDTVLQKILNNVQEIVFRQAWVGQTYPEIAESYGYNANYIKDVGYKLWKLLSKTFEEKVTKSNFRSVIRRQYVAYQYTWHASHLSVSPLEYGGATLTHSDCEAETPNQVFEGKSLSEWTKDCISKGGESVASEEEIVSHQDKINRVLKPATSRRPLVVDLFAGCGGLSLGFEAQGFETHGFEMDTDSCVTYRKNLKGNCTQIVLTPETVLPAAPVLIGGPPCQPFSVGGNQKGLKDSRDGFPIFISAVEKLRPEIWLFENVRGLLYRNKWYLDEIAYALQSLGYVVEVKLLNAVNFGVPQNRERVIVVGHKGNFSFSKVLERKISAGEALGELAFQVPPESKFLTPNMDEYVAKYEKASFCKRPRDLHLDEPARTLTCRNLAGATGDMHRIKLPDGRRRRLFLREAARLQSFPDWFEFVGTETSCFNQVGNAVSPLLAFHLAGMVRTYLQSAISVILDSH